MIWCTHDPNSHIPIFCKLWSFIWRCFFACEYFSGGSLFGQFQSREWIKSMCSCVCNNWYCAYSDILSYSRSTHICWMEIRLWVCNFIKKRLQHKCFPVKFEKFLRTTFLKNNVCNEVKYNFISTSRSLKIKMDVDFEMFAARNGKKFQEMSRVWTKSLWFW